MGALDFRYKCHYYQHVKLVHQTRTWSSMYTGTHDFSSSCILCWCIGLAFHLHCLDKKNTGSGALCSFWTICKRALFISKHCLTISAVKVKKKNCVCVCLVLPESWGCMCKTVVPGGWAGRCCLASFYARHSTVHNYPWGRVGKDGHVRFALLVAMPLLLCASLTYNSTFYYRVQFSVTEWPSNVSVKRILRRTNFMLSATVLVRFPITVLKKSRYVRFF